MNKCHNISIILSVIVVALITVGCDKSQSDMQSNKTLEGPYLGQILPGQEAELFAPGIVSKGLKELKKHIGTRKAKQEHAQRRVDQKKDEDKAFGALKYEQERIISHNAPGGKFFRATPGRPAVSWGSLSEPRKHPLPPHHPPRFGIFRIEPPMDIRTLKVSVIQIRGGTNADGEQGL